MQKIIVCGTDFSDSARAATEVAATLADLVDASLHVVHCVAREAGRGAQLLDDELRSVRTRHPKLSIEPVIRAGDPEEVAAYAETVPTLLIVVGATGTDRTLFKVGGTAERLITRARRPVLVVRDPAPLLAWSRGEGLSAAALVSDDVASDRVLEWVRFLGRHRMCRVALARGYYVDQLARRYGLASPPITEAVPEIAALVERDLKRRAHGLGPDTTYRPVLAVGRIADHLLADPEVASASLLVVGNHRHRGLGTLASVTSRVLQLSDAPAILTVPADSPRFDAASAQRPQIDCVVVPLDLSARAATAIPYAHALLDPRGGRVHVVHVSSRDASEASVRELRARLQALTQDSRVGVVTLTEVLPHDDVATAVNQYAARVGADVIVVASHVRAGLRRALLGSVADGIVRDAAVPVMIIRAPKDM